MTLREELNEVARELLATFGAPATISRRTKAYNPVIYKTATTDVTVPCTAAIVSTETVRENEALVTVTYVVTDELVRPGDELAIGSRTMTIDTVTDNDPHGLDPAIFEATAR